MSMSVILLLNCFMFFSHIWNIWFSIFFIQSVGFQFTPLCFPAVWKILLNSNHDQQACSLEYDMDKRKDLLEKLVFFSLHNVIKPGTPASFGFGRISSVHTLTQSYQSTRMYEHSGIDRENLLMLFNQEVTRNRQ